MNDKEKLTASNLSKIIDATLVERGENDTSLYIKKNKYKGYDWIMISPKTGNHTVREYNSDPVMSERVKAHWNGFQKSQN